MKRDLDLDALERRFSPYRSTDGKEYGGDSKVLALIQRLREAERISIKVKAELARYKSVLDYLGEDIGAVEELRALGNK